MNTGGLLPPDFKTYYKAKVNKGVGLASRQIGKRVESIYIESITVT